MRQPKLPLLMSVAITLQDATNYLFGRKFVIGMGVLKGKGPAVFMAVRRVFRKDLSLVVDLKTFLEVAADISTKEMSAVEKTGYTVKKEGGMEYDFHVPVWAFPRAYLEILMAADEVLNMFKSYDEALDRVAKSMVDAGVPDAEVQKFKDKYCQSKKLTEDK